MLERVWIKGTPPTIGGKVNQCTMANGMELP